ncbi:hypothetical protein NQ314_016837 [Rhamnusium bicolor]|uniref:EF-hand domain-containing protein n=1 Tax=Rhamnusium bicolor TaxID=1586634 RepID=A0AAV8WUR9_9CUCU|nr:hypothetical protein NQ314_016837 [Rhamnusium bicolor]
MSKTKKSTKCAKSFGESIDSSMDSMEETRFKKKFQDVIYRLSKKFHFTYAEMEGLLIVYYKLQKQSKDFYSGVDKSQFRDVLHSALDMTDDYLMDRIFYALDRGPSAFISMETWAATLSLFLRGTLEEKINYCYSVYDTMGDGTLGRENLFHLLKNSLVSQGTDEEAEESAKDMIEVITKKMDIDRDGKISFNDYKQSVLRQPMLLEAFGQCLPSRTDIYTFMTTCITNMSKM